MRVGAAFAVVLASISAIAGGCGRAPEEKRYPVRGQVLGIRADVREVRLAHDDIDGLMPAMTMSFGVQDATVLNGLRAGDIVEGTLVVADSNSWLTAITRVDHKPIPPDPAEDESSSAAAAPPLLILEPGQLVPDVPLIDQDDRLLGLSGLRGKAVAVTFIYTRCPLPEFCPRLDRNFRAAQRLMAERPELAGRVQLLSVTFDPTYDTPAILRAHAAKLEADLSTWRFVTGQQSDVDRLAAAFGVTALADEGTATITHNLRTAVIGTDGTLRRVFNGGDWTATDLVAEMTQALAQPTGP